LTERLALTILAEAVWGSIVAVVLQYTDWGRWLDKEMTWLPALVGTGGAGLIAVIYLGWPVVGWSALFLFAAFVPLFIRAFANLYRQWRTFWNEQYTGVDDGES